MVNLIQICATQESCVDELNEKLNIYFVLGGKHYTMIKSTQHNCKFHKQL